MQGRFQMEEWLRAWHICPGDLSAPGKPGVGGIWLEEAELLKSWRRVCWMRLGLRKPLPPFVSKKVPKLVGLADACVPPFPGTRTPWGVSVLPVYSQRPAAGSKCRLLWQMLEQDLPEPQPAVKFSLLLLKTAPTNVTPGLPCSTRCRGRPGPPSRAEAASGSESSSPPVQGLEEPAATPQWLRSHLPCCRPLLLSARPPRSHRGLPCCGDKRNNQ